MNVSEYVRLQVEAGVRDPEKIAQDYLAAALASGNPGEWLAQPVRAAVGSAFSSVQKALRSEQLAGQAGGGAQAPHGSPGTGGPASALTRQAHNDGLLYHPPTGTWIVFADATVPQLEDAIAYYRGQISAHQQTITGLEKAIAEIQAVPGATCLRDTWAARAQKPARKRGRPRKAA